MNRRTARILLLPLLLLFLMTPKVRSQAHKEKSAKSGTSKTANQKSAQATAGVADALQSDAQWVESTLKQMSLEEKVGQVLFTTYHGSFTSTDSPAYAQLLHDVEVLHVGGFINVTQGSPLGFLKSQAYPTAELSNQLQAKSRLPLLIGADFERGTAMRVDEGTSFPTAMALAAAGEPKDAYTMGKITALESRAVGVQWIYAPDADVNSNPGQSHHQYALVRGRPAAGRGVRDAIHPRSARERRVGHSETFSRPRRYHCGFAHRFAGGERGSPTTG